MMPISESAENVIAHMTRILPDFLFTVLSAYARAVSTMDSTSGAGAALFSPLSSSVVVIPNISESVDNREISGQLRPRSYFETALSVIPSLSANSFCVKFFSFLSSAIKRAIFSFSILDRFLSCHIVCYSLSNFCKCINRLMVEIDTKPTVESVNKDVFYYIFGVISIRCTLYCPSAIVINAIVRG